MNERLRRNSFLTLLIGAVIMVGCSQAPTPSNSPGAGSRVFELRTYTAHEGKLADLERRFRDHTVRLFEKHGMTNVGYWIPQDSLGENTLVYLLAYPSRAAGEQAWLDFRADPEWVAARTASEVNGPLVQRVVSIFLDPTDYSPMR